MKTLEEFQDFIYSNDELDRILHKLDKKRKKNVRWFFAFLIFFVVIIGIVFFDSYTDTQRVIETGSQDHGRYNLLYIAIACYAVISIVYAARAALKRKANTPKGEYQNVSYLYKNNVVRKVINFCDSSFHYGIQEYVSPGALFGSGMFVDKEYDLTGSDLIRGVYEGVAFDFSDITMSIPRAIALKDEDKDKIIFNGSFFVAEFNKRFKNPVFVYPRKKYMNYLQREGEEVRLESPEFARLFTVFSPDQIEARYILSTSLMARIERLTEIMGDRLHIVFANNNVYIANNNNEDRFERIWSHTVKDKTLLVRYFNELNEQLSIIHELKLNIKIWA